jgi:hypothetical protein
MTQVDAINAFAANAHEAWRKTFDPVYAETGVPSKTRIKPNGDGTEGDINVPFNQLHPTWQAENLEAGEGALYSVVGCAHDLAKAAVFIHKFWCSRNPKQEHNAHLHVPYEDLPREEQLKDEQQALLMQQLLKVT